MGPLLGCVRNKSRVCYTPRGNLRSWGPDGHGCLAQEAGLSLRAGLSCLRLLFQEQGSGR